MVEIQPDIIAGDSGARLWLLSSQQYPKQFLKLTSDYSLLQNNELLDSIMYMGEYMYDYF